MGEETAQHPTVAIPPPTDPAVDWKSEIGRVIRSEIRKAVPRALDESLDRRLHDQELAGLVHLLAARSNDAKDEVLRKALTLYGLALDAREKGNKLAIISPDDFIVHDIIGFEPVDEALKSA